MQSIASKGLTGSDSIQDFTRDEQDFEWLGSTTNMQLNHFVKVIDDLVAQ
jgi:hypothetical protein